MKRYDEDEDGRYFFSLGALLVVALVVLAILTCGCERVLRKRPISPLGEAKEAIRWHS